MKDVMKDVMKDIDKWKIWYVSLIKWTEEEENLKHYYNIRYAESDDGINFKREGKVCIDFKNEFEYAIVRPFVIKERGFIRCGIHTEKEKTSALTESVMQNLTTE